MKSSVFKYIFIAFVIMIAIFTIYMIYFKSSDKPQEQTNSILEEPVQESKSLRLAISNYDTINPLLTKNKEVINISKLIYEPLIHIDENYKTELCLAKECSKTSATTYVIKIDNQIQWQDGTSLTAKDVQFTIDRLKEGKSVYSYNVEKIIGVEIIDSETIKINLSEEVPFFEYNLTFPILCNNYYLGEDFNTSTKTPIGTGPYGILKIENNMLTLAKNEKWHNKEKQPLKIETIQLKLYNEIGEVYNSFKLGNVDIFTTSYTDLEKYIGTIGYAKKEWKGRQFDYLAINCQQENLQDSNVRKAIRYCIDKSNIVSSVYNNQYDVAEFPLDYGNYLYPKEAIHANYNQEQAKKILTENGWVYTNNRWQKKENNKTKRLDFTLTVPSSNPQRVAVAENIKAQLAQIGIKITIQKVSDAQYQKALEKKNYEMILTGVFNSFSPDVSSFFGSNNLQNYTNIEMNQLLEEVKNIQDEALLKEKYSKIIELYDQDVPFISLYRNRQTAVKSQNVAGEIIANNYYTYYNIYNWNRR